MKHNLPSTIYARFIRIHPKACKQACVMRAEIYGCLDGKVCYVYYCEKLIIVCGDVNDFDGGDDDDHG